MTSAAVLFYGRRSRPSRSFDDLGFGSSSSSSPSLSSSSSSSSSSDSIRISCSSSSNHRRHRKTDLHRRQRQNCLDDTGDKSRRPSHAHLNPSPRSAVTTSEPHQPGCIGESPSRNIVNGGTVHDLSGRYSNNRLPGAVLLAKERLLQRLRGGSVSGISRHSRETSASVHCNDFWAVNADWETSVPREQAAANIDALTESPLGVHQQSVPQEPKYKPPGLNQETLLQLNHEIFLEDQNVLSHSTSRSSNDCCICLENFVEGNELISLHCGHRFHTSCLYPWLQTCGECPYCRSCIVLANK